MKPIKLTMSAFGPYGEKQELDFSVLEGRNIFLVTGVTGAGKTTIFDAISYALFGEPSGSSREAGSLRSHFASEDTETYVDLTFEVKNEVYQIIRSPEQEIKKKRGEGTTTKAASVELILPKGEKPLTRSLDVQNRVREIVGVDKDQFRQIVMLPQGEFRKLLESKSSDRESIFRKIFGTQAFQRIQLKLRERKAKLTEDLRLDRNSVGIYIKNLKVPQGHVLEGLKDQADIDTGQVKDSVLLLKEDDEKWLVEQNHRLAELKGAHSKAKTELTLADANNKKLESKLEAEEKLRCHMGQEEMIMAQKEIVLVGKKALEVKVIDDEVKMAHQNMKEREKAVAQATQREIESGALLQEVVAAVMQSKGENPHRQQLRDEINRLIPYKEKVTVYASKQKEMETTKVQLEHCIKQKEEAEKTIQELKVQLENVQQTITRGIKAEGEWNKLEAQLEEKNKEIKSLGTLYKAYEAYFEKREAYNLQKQALVGYESQFKASRKRFQEQEDVFRKGQAGLLAESLEEGNPCPVCGSTHHPCKSVKGAGVLTEEDLKKLQDTKEKDETLYQGALNQLTQLHSLMESLEQNNINPRIEELADVLGGAFAEITDQVKAQQYVRSLGGELRKVIDTLKVQQQEMGLLIQDQTKAGETKQACESQLVQQEALRGKLGQSLTDLTAGLAAMQEQLRGIEEVLPDQLRDPQKLEQRIVRLQEELQQSEKLFEQAQEREKQVQAHHTSNLKDKEIKQEEYEKIAKEWKGVSDRLEEVLRTQSFEDYESYQKAYKPRTELEVLEEKILGYEQQTKTLGALSESLCKAVEGLMQVEVEALEKVVRAYEQQEGGLIEAIAGIKARIEHNDTQLHFIQQTSEKIAGKEKEYGLVAELENVAFGDTANKKRMTFESYVLTAYFDEIIFASNRRLEKMSAGRFELKRKEELAKGRGKQGLDLEVLDYHTGRTRDVKTLSGGEGFKASLALALGLADVIGCHAGGISIETMFVDEGFGTLDPASLDSAVECLLGLQQGGRMIGIISHVPELRERVEVMLEVSTSTKGSQAAFIV